MKESSHHRLSALLLQGPVGGFFTNLQVGLQDAGWQVRRIVFNGGDQVFSPLSSISYRGTLDAYPDWLERLCTSEKPDVIILFGDRRPVHAAAIRVADVLGVPVWCFEEGYLRPDYVTFEPGGNNARSPLSSDQHDKRELLSPCVNTVRGSPAFWRVAVRALVYYAALALLEPSFPHYVHHRTRPLCSEVRCWTLSFVRKLASMASQAERQSPEAGPGGPLFIFAAQVHDDLQVVHHGRGWTVPTAIKEVVASFAQHASSTGRLIIKVHPLARGHFDHRRFVRQVALQSGCAERVAVVDTGSMDALLRNCAGLITINSTSGLAALHRNRPVLVFGDTFYARPGLAHKCTDPQDLDRFWTSPTKPESRDWQDLRAAMIQRSLLPGSFYRPTTWPTLVLATIRRLEGQAPATLHMPVGRRRHEGWFFSEILRRVPRLPWKKRGARIAEDAG